MDVNMVVKIVYFTGVVLCPFVVGFLFKKSGKGTFGVFEDGIPVFFLSILWPLVLAILIGAVAVFLVASIPGALCSFMLEAGRWIGKMTDRSIEGKKL